MTALIADIGGTNARFALVGPDDREGRQPMTLPCRDFNGPAEAARAYLDQVAPNLVPDQGAFAVACPVLGDHVSLTNSPWNFSATAVRDALGMRRLEVVNDFIAVALCVPLLTNADRVLIGPAGQPESSAPVAVIGPGTGLGVSAMVPVGDGWRALPCEGGHVTMAPTNDREEEVLRWLRHRDGHVSAEHVLAGPGLVTLYGALRALAGLPPKTATPADIAPWADAGDAQAQETLEMYFAMLGTVTGNLVLSIGGLGGVVIAGGVIPRMLPRFQASSFRDSFENKGRFRAYLRDVPVHVVTHPYPAFLGLAGLVG